MFDSPTPTPSISYSLDSSTSTAVAAAPFDDPDADVVLCTADNTLFRVYKLLLSLASPVFKDMFKMPPPQADSELTDTDGRPVLVITEDSKTMTMVLNFCYPFVDATIETLDDIQAALGVMTKYVMDSAIQAICRQLESPRFLEHEHLRVFAIAYRYRLRDTAILAMKESLRYPLLDQPVSELREIPASGYHQYLSYRKLCSERIAKVIPGGEDSTTWSSVEHHFSQSRCDCRSISRGNLVFKQWSFEFEQWATKSLLACATPETVTDLRYLKEIFRKASACPTCSRAVLQHFPSFAIGLASQVRTAISQVSPTLEF